MVWHLQKIAWKRKWRGSPRWTYRCDSAPNL